MKKYFLFALMVGLLSCKNNPNSTTKTGEDTLTVDTIFDPHNHQFNWEYAGETSVTDTINHKNDCFAHKWEIEEVKGAYLNVTADSHFTIYLPNNVSDSSYAKIQKLIPIAEKGKEKDGIVKGGAMRVVEAEGSQELYFFDGNNNKICSVVYTIWYNNEEEYTPGRMRVVQSFYLQNDSDYLELIPDKSRHFFSYPK